MSDSTTTAQQQVPSTPALKMLAVLGGIAMISGFLVVLADQLTKPIIEENQQRAIERAVFKVVPEASIRKSYLVTADGVRPAEGTGKETDGITVYGAYDDRGRLKGLVAEGAGMGYSGLVHLLYGYDPECVCIHRFQVLKMTETPGLGDKITSDLDFQANFKSGNGLSARLNNAGTALENPIVTVKHGTKKNPWEIDAISGATITSTAVGKALNQSTQELLPKLVPHIDSIKQIEPPQPEPKKEHP